MTNNNPDPNSDRSFTLEGGKGLLRGGGAGGLRGNPEQRLKRLEGLLGQLLNNPSIDNARRGPLQIANADVLPGTSRMTVFQLSHPLRVNQSSIPPAPSYSYDSTNNWPFVSIALPNTAGAFALVAPVLLNIHDLATGVDSSAFVKTHPRLRPEFRVQIAVPSVGATQTTRVGMADQNVSIPTDGIFFRATNANWFAVTLAASSETATDTGVAPSTGAPQILRIKATDTMAEFFIDDTLVHRETATIPTVSLVPGYALVRTTGAPQLRGSRWIALREDIGGL